MKNRGYIPISRAIFEHQLWREDREFSRFEAWLDLIQMARFEDAMQYVGNRRILVKRGQILASFRFLSERWGWSTKKVGGFLNLLIADMMMSKETDKETGQTIVTVCNYDKYNPKAESQETPEETGVKHQGNTKETNINKDNNLNKVIPPVIPQSGDGVCDSGFEKVWAMYGRKGNKKTSERKRANLKNHCREAAIKHIPRYVASTPDIQYRKNFETYLNQEAWNDEIIQRQNDEKPNLRSRKLDSDFD